MQIIVEEPQWIELQDESNTAELKQELLDLMKDEPESDFMHPKIAVVILGDETNYSKYKEVLQEFKIPSQIVRVQNAK